MTSPYDPTPFQIRRLRIYEAGCFLIVLTAITFAIVLYWLGISNHWTRLPAPEQAGLLPEADRVLLAGEGDWLVWVAAGTGGKSRSRIDLLGASDLSHPGRAVLLRPPHNDGIRPIDVLDGDLIVLVTVPQISSWQILQHGWTSLTNLIKRERKLLPEPPPNLSLNQEPDLLPTPVTVYLQRVNLSTGRVVTTAAGGTSDLGATDTDKKSPSTTSELTDLEGGYVNLSPDRLNLAWWSAREMTGKSPLSATVTEHLEIFSAGPKFKRLLGKEIQTDGTLSIRSRLLERLGQPAWMGNDRCLVLSTLDSGSLIPFDCGAGMAEATVPLSALQQTLTEGAPVNNYDPEGFEVLQEGEGHAPEILVWTRLPGSLHLFVLDSLFHLIRHTQVDDKNLDLSRPLWLKRSQVLLVEDTSVTRLVGFTAQGEQEGVFPIPPDWGESFQILGENREGDLLGYNRGSFLSAKSGDGAWETMNIFQ